MIPFISVGDLCEFTYGEPLKEQVRQAGAVSVFGSNGVVGWHDQAITRGPTIVVGRKGSIGEVHYSEGACFPIDTTYYVDATKQPCELRWLYHMLRKLDMGRLNRASAVPGLNRDDAYDQRIPFPPREQQMRVVALLDRAERIRAIRQHSSELANALPRATYFEFFANPGRWPEVPLADLCEEVIDCPHSTPIYASTRSGHPCVRSSDIQDDYLDLSETKQVSEAEYQKRIARGRPVPGDVIYCREGARYGNAARVLDDTLLCLGQRTMLFRPNTRTVTELIWGFLSSASAYRQASRALDGSASPHVNIGEIVAFRVPLPPVVVQEEYARVIRGHDLVRVRLRESVRKAEHLFDSLLQMAFEARL